MLPCDISHKTTELCWAGTNEYVQTGFNTFLIAFDQCDCTNKTVARREMRNLWEKCSLKLLCFKIDSQGLHGLNQDNFFFLFMSHALKRIPCKYLWNITAQTQN